MSVRQWDIVINFCGWISVETSLEILLILVRIVIRMTESPCRKLGGGHTTFKLFNMIIIIIITTIYQYQIISTESPRLSISGDFRQRYKKTPELHKRAKIAYFPSVST